ncbi:uncharacterized protein LOC144108849 isoform X1 [Amblyomma americanum]
MEPDVKQESRSNPFNICPLLHKFEKELCRQIVLLTIRLDPAHSPTPPTLVRREARQDAKQIQEDWERLKRDILAGQHGAAFTYRLRNLEQLEQVVLFTDQCAGPGAAPLSQRSSFDASRNAPPMADSESLPEEALSDAEPCEGFKTPPMSSCSSPLSPPSIVSPSTPQSLQSPQSPVSSRSLSEFSATGSVRQNSPFSSSPGGLLRRSRSQDSPRARVEAIGFKERVKVFKKRYPRRERTLDDLRDITLARSPAQQWWEPMGGERSQPEADHDVDESPRTDVTDLEGVHESLDRMSRIMKEMALLVNVSTMYQPHTDRHGRRRSSSTSARRRMSRARRASHYHHGAHSPLATQNPGTPPGATDAPLPGSSSSSRSSRDLALPSDSDETQVSWRRGSHLRPQRRRELVATSALKTVAQVTKGASDQAVNLSWGFSDSQSSDSRKMGTPRRPPGFRSDAELSRLQGPDSDTADERVASASTEDRFQGPFVVREPSLVACSDELSLDRSVLFEAASADDGNYMGRLSPGEVMLSTYADGAESSPEPVFPSLQPEECRRGLIGSARSVRCVDPGPSDIMLTSYTDGAESPPEASLPSLRSEDRGRSFKGTARSVSWSDPERCHTEFFGAANDVDDALPRSSSDDSLLLGGAPLYKSAKDDAYASQHIWRYANSETGRVIDEAAMRRLEMYKTTLVDNIDGQPPHMQLHCGWRQTLPPRPASDCAGCRSCASSRPSRQRPVARQPAGNAWPLEQLSRRPATHRRCVPECSQGCALRPIAGRSVAAFVREL